MGKLLLHIGSEKTGSRSLQAYLNLSSEFGLPFDYLTGAGDIHGNYVYSTSAKLALKGYSNSELKKILEDTGFTIQDTSYGEDIGLDGKLAPWIIIRAHA